MLEQDHASRARALGLTYVCDCEHDGISRRRCGRGFAYHHPNGRLIERGSSLRRWIESLAIPPAWTEVWIAPARRCHILATGRDDAQRKQYIYHPDWEVHRRDTVFERMRSFGKALPRIRRAVAEHLQRPELDRERALAAVIRLLDLSLIRVGNEDSALNGSGIGATTLAVDHLVDEETPRLKFNGKGGKAIEVIVRDAHVCAVIRAGARLGCGRLFCYEDADGKCRVVDAGDVNEYLREITGEPFTAKDFRTWGGSAHFADYARRMLVQQADQDPELVVRAATAGAARRLRNTPAVAQAHYIHHWLPESVRDGTLLKAYQRVRRNGRRRRTPSALNLPERLTLDLISGGADR